MHGILRTVVAVFVLIGFASSASDFGLLLSTAWAASPERTRCPLHAAKCCCPKVCQSPPPTRPSCHKSESGESGEGLKPAQRIPKAACVVKAGCGRSESAVAPPLSFKDFVPEPSEQIGFDGNSSLFHPPNNRLSLLDRSASVFHPPRDHQSTTQFGV